MMENIRQELEATISPLLKGIFKDCQLLVHQEIALVKCEAATEIKKVKIAALFFGVSAAASLLSLALFSLALVHFLLWLLPTLVLWECYAICALFLACIAYVFLLKLKCKLADTDVTLPKSRQTLKEMTYV